MQCLFELRTRRTHGAPDTERDQQTNKQKTNTTFSHLQPARIVRVSGLVASGAVYFGQLDRRSRRTSAYVTTRAFVPFFGTAYVTTGSIRAVQWSGSHDISACGRTLARWAIELWSISHDLGEDYKSKGSTWRRGEVICRSVAELLERV